MPSQNKGCLKGGDRGFEMRPKSRDYNFGDDFETVLHKLIEL